MFRAFTLSLLIASPAVAETVRFAVVVGNNAGRGELPPLRYAESDAGKMARVLTELGDVAPERLVLLQGRPVKDVEAALKALSPQVQAARAVPENRTVLLFYFSGHSDGEAIELGQELLPYSRLKALLGGAGTDVRVVIIDACRSAAGFREKGGRPADAFAIKLTDTLSATGDAFITSSAQDEAALESSEMMGSIFTHHLVSGLRGAADTSGDKLVTLGEAYRYAYDQTVSRTAMMPVGAQHPSYDYRLSGQGELVLSSLAKATAQLVFPPGTERVVVLDTLRDQIIAEVPTAATKELALPPGQYGLRLFKEGQSYGGRITLTEGGRRTLSWDELTPISSAVAVARKGPVVATSLVDDWREERLVSLSMGVVPAISQLGVQGLLRVGFEPRLGHGLSVALQGAYAGAGTVSEAGVEARVGFRFGWRVGLAWFGVGGELGPALLWQSTSSGTAFSPAGVVAPRASARLFVGGPFVLTLEGEAGLIVLSVDGKVAARFRPAGTLGVAFRF
ncbi:MAG: caspase family protein [Myxococcota bacterium]